jgi:hypothetical protein
MGVGLVTVLVPWVAVIAGVLIRVAVITMVVVAVRLTGAGLLAHGGAPFVRGRVTGRRHSYRSIMCV